MFSPAKVFRSGLGFAALLALSTAAFAADKNPKISHDLSVAAASGSVHVIIQYRVDPTDSDLNQVWNASGSVRHRLHSVHAIHAVVPQTAIDGLTQNPNVAYVSLDRPIGAKQISTTSAEYTTEPINAPQVWQYAGFDGTGVGVAVIDSGINDLPDLDTTGKKAHSRIVYSQSFVPSAPGDASDYFGHGTHVAGLIAGNGADSTGKKYFRTFSGAAPNANLINLRVLDENGQGTDSSVIAAIETAIELKDTYNIKVINLSIGRPIFESFTLDPLCQAVEQAWRSGIVVVVAAGNNGRNLSLNAEGYGTIEAPGNDPYVLTVGAVKTMGTATIKDDLVASYSSKGPTFIDHIVKPDIMAPGNVVTSLQFPNDPILALNPGFGTPYAFYMNKPPAGNSTDYFPLSGTSMSAGVASGAVALLEEAFPKLTPDQAKAFLMRNANRSYFPKTSVATDPTTGVSYTAHNDILTIGAGYLDIAATMVDVYSYTSKLPSGTAMSPVAAYDPKVNSVYLLEFPGSIWGSGSASPAFTPLWGTYTPLWGTYTPLWGTFTPLWGTSDVYGESAFGGPVAATSATWGWTPLYGATNTTGQPIVAATTDSSALWGTKPLANINDPAAFTALWGNGTQLWGTTTPLWGTFTPLWGTATPVDGNFTPLWGTTTPLWGTFTPLWGTYTPLWGTYTPLWGTMTPLWGTGVPVSSTFTPLWGTSTPQATNTLWGTSTVGSTSVPWGASSTPQGNFTPLWGTSTELGK